jgi:membrane protease YdiL (CAAX protease family)
VIKKIFAGTFQNEEQELALHPPSQKFDYRILVILVWTALGLSIIHYWGDANFFAGVLENCGLKKSATDLRTWTTTGNTSLHHLGWWVGTMIFVYLVVPVLIVKIIFKENLSDYGFKWKGAFDSWGLYVVMLAVMIPLVLYFSSTKSFQNRYPFYTPGANEKLFPSFWIWEGMYFVQFISLEFFFRGFVTLGLRKRFGYYSIFIMMVPYCMIHFGKPMPETIGAIFAGLILGTLSMKSRSILLGILIHYSVAISMDLFALWRKGFLG